MNGREVEIPELEIDPEVTEFAQKFGKRFEILEHGACLDYEEKKRLAEYFRPRVLYKFKVAEDKFLEACADYRKMISTIRDLIADEIASGGPDVAVLESCLDRKTSCLQRLERAFGSIANSQTVLVAQAFEDVYLLASMQYPVQRVGDVPHGHAVQFVDEVRDNMPLIVAYAESIESKELEDAEDRKDDSGDVPMPPLELPPPVVVPDSPPSLQRPVARELFEVPDSPPLGAAAEAGEASDPDGEPSGGFVKHCLAARRRCLARDAKTIDIDGYTTLVTHKVDEFTGRRWRRPKYLREQTLVRLINDVKELIESSVNEKYVHNDHGTKSRAMLKLVDQVFKFWWESGSKLPYDNAVAATELMILDYVADLR